MSAPNKCSFTKEQVIVVANRFTKEMGTKEFVERFQKYVANKGTMDPDKLFDELEALQKFVYAEWDIYPDVDPDDMLDSLHIAAKVYDEPETHKAMDFMCSRIQWVLDVVGTAHMGPQGGMGGAGGAGAHGHSHNGQPCHGHAHGPGGPHQGGGGHPGQPNPVQMQIMQFAVQCALSEEERSFMAETQKGMMEGKLNPREFDDDMKKKMVSTQTKIMTWMQQNGPMVKEQMDAGFQTALTEEERQFASATQKKVLEGTIQDPEHEDLKKVQTLQGKVHAYVSTMLSFLTANQQQSAAAQESSDSNNNNNESAKEK